MDQGKIVSVELATNRYAKPKLPAAASRDNSSIADEIVVVLSEEEEDTIASLLAGGIEDEYLWELALPGLMTAFAMVSLYLRRRMDNMELRNQA